MAALSIAGVCLLLCALTAPSWAAALFNIQCPNLGINNCVANNGLAFSDGCRVIVCIGWRSAVMDPSECPPATRPSELAQCRKLEDRLARMQSGVLGNAETLVSCPEFAGIDLCATADPFFSYHDGCDYHLCDGSGGALERTRNTCPEAALPEHKFYCASNFNWVVRAHNSRHACKEQMNSADRICGVMWPGYKFGDACYGGNDYVCGPGGRLLIRPPARLCPLLGASESIKCREVAREVADLVSESRGFTCPELQYAAVCTEENRGLVYNDGCNQVLCDGDGSGLTEGRVCKLRQAFDESQVAGREFCARQTDLVHRRMSESRRHTDPCATPANFCIGEAFVGESYFNGCNYCTCTGNGRAKCDKRKCPGYYGTLEEFHFYCRTAAYRLE